MITWTSNIQGWISHGGFEFSSRLQSIEIYTPRTDSGGALVGIKQEVVLYDPEAFVAPRSVESALVATPTQYVAPALSVTVVELGAPSIIVPA